MSAQPIIDDDNDMEFTEYMLGIHRNSTTQNTPNSESSTSFSSDESYDHEPSHLNKSLDKSRLINNNFSLLVIPDSNDSTEAAANISSLKSTFSQEEFEQIHPNNFPEVLRDPLENNILFSEELDELLRLIPDDICPEFLEKLESELLENEPNGSIVSEQPTVTPLTLVPQETVPQKTNYAISSGIKKFTVLNPKVDPNYAPLSQRVFLKAPVKPPITAHPKFPQRKIVVRPAVKQLSIIKPKTVPKFISQPQDFNPIKVSMQVPGQEAVQLFTVKNEITKTQPPLKSLQYVINGQDPLKSRITVLHPQNLNGKPNLPKRPKNSVPMEIPIDPQQVAEKRKLLLEQTLSDKERIIREKPYLCPNCNTRYARLHNLEKHIHQHCTMSRTQACPHCHILVNKTQFENHIIDKHGRTQMMCEFCPKYFKNLIAFEHHARSAHKNVNPLAVKRLLKGILNMKFDFNILEFVQKF